MKWPDNEVEKYKKLECYEAVFIWSHNIPFTFPTQERGWLGESKTYFLHVCMHVHACVSTELKKRIEKISQSLSTNKL